MRRGSGPCGIGTALLSLGVTCCVAGLVGCSGSPVTPPMASSGAAPSTGSVQLAYRNTQAGFGLTPPPGWRVGAGAPVATVTFVAPTADTTNGQPVTVNLTVVITPTDADLESNVDAARQQFAGIFPEYQPVVDQPITLPTGVGGHLLGGTYTYQGPLRNLQLVVAARGNLYVVSATAPASSFGRYEHIIRQSLQSFVLL